MTSDLEQIAEAIGKSTLCPESTYDLKVGRMNPPCECCQKHITERLRDMAAIRAWIAANKESPQRKAFVEASIRVVQGRVAIMNGPDIEKAWVAAYRAMIEAEKVAER